MHGFGVAQLALFRVGGAADRQHLGSALVQRHRAGGVVGAAGAQDEHGLARKLHAVGFAQVGKAQIIGVVAVEQAVFIDHRVHRADGAGAGVDEGAVLHHQLFIGDGHIDGLELPPLQKGAGVCFGGQGAQLVAVPAEQLMDGLGVGVSQLAADESVFHLSPPSGSRWGRSSTGHRTGR